MQEDIKIELVKSHLGLSISTDISDFENVDCMIYSESTADGYDVYICTNDSKNPSICEDVYYYDHDLADALREQIRYGDETFYIDEYIYEDCYIDDMFVEVFNEFVEEIIENDELDITLEEINSLKEEYGITEEVEGAEAS
tara:strand:+ start:620 stop:1042 length:423 start_codon:yes stop_codon:yes gene_type:complete